MLCLFFCAIVDQEEKAEVSYSSDSVTIEGISVKETSSDYIQTESAIESEAEKFSGFKLTEKSFRVGNTPSSLNQNGLLYCDAEKCYLTILTEI